MCDDSYSEWCFKRLTSQQDVRELDRIYALVDPRPSTSSDADAASIAECRQIWRERVAIAMGKTEENPSPARLTPIAITSPTPNYPIRRR
jgi:hypothetical protein